MTWQHLPALRTLRIFEAAARHLNWSRAAAELHLTHGAVSHQIKALEAELGVVLFNRQGRRTTLTEAGHRLADGVRAGLDTLAGVVARVRERSNAHMLTLSVLPSFAAGWLVARLGDFIAAESGIELNLQSNTALADFRSDGVDGAIRYGSGSWPDTMTEKLLDDEIFPVMSPEFLHRHRITRPEQLLDVPRVSSGRQPWAPWLLAAGVAPEEPRAMYSDAELAYQAAVRGHGAALGRISLVADRLRDGSLVAPFPLRVASPYAYYLVYPEASLRKPAFVRFRSWLLQRLASDAPSTPPRPPADP